MMVSLYRHFTQMHMTDVTRIGVWDVQIVKNVYGKISSWLLAIYLNVRYNSTIKSDGRRKKHVHKKRIKWNIAKVDEDI